MWELQKIVFLTWWGSQSATGTLSSLRDLLGHHGADMEGKRFNACDEFLFDVVRVKLTEVSALVNDSVSALSVKKSEIPKLSAKVVDFVFQQHVDPAKSFLASFLQAGLLYVEVKQDSN